MICDKSYQDFTKILIATFNKILSRINKILPRFYQDFTKMAKFYTNLTTVLQYFYVYNIACKSHKPVIVEILQKSFLYINCIKVARYSFGKLEIFGMN